ncbi:MAG: uncharacterized protein JWN15_2111 [Firmicutes bacterium]|nr:uncharacterized protein [Bacillota bacterium]
MRIRRDVSIIVMIVFDREHSFAVRCQQRWVSAIHNETASKLVPLLAGTPHEVLLLAGTEQGVFLLQSGADRQAWQLTRTTADPSWSYGHVSYDRRSGTIYAGGHSASHGPAVWRSADLGQTWRLSSKGITYGDDGPGVQRIWYITAAHGAHYAGVDPAGLFRSDDGGETWCEAGTPIRSLPEYATWRRGKGGIPVHSILIHPDDPQQIWVAIAGGGVLYSADGGQAWSARNPLLPGGGDPGPGGSGPALHAQRLVAVPGKPEHLVQQNHQGVYHSEDAGLTWHDATGDLPTPFGFPVAVHPGEPPALFAIPHHNEAGVRYIDGARIAVWRSRDRGLTWTVQSHGLPQETAYTSVLRDAMTTDGLEPPGLYFGTTSGAIFGSVDGGETWSTLAESLPEILSLTAVEG